MKILALLVLLTAPAGATLTGCQDTSGALVLAKPRQTATGTQPIGCINYSFDILSASVAFVGSSVTHPQIWVSTIAGRNGSGLYLSSYTLVGSSVYVMGHAQFGSSVTFANGAGIGGAVTFNGSSVTVRGEVLSSTLTAHAAYILNAATFGSSVTLRDGEAIGGAGAFNSSWTAKGAFGVGGTLALTSGQAITGAATFKSSQTAQGSGVRFGIGIGEVVSGRVQQASDYLLLGSPTSGSTGRGALRFGGSGWDLPSNVNTDSDGDKLTIWNTATDKAAIGMDSRAAIWFQSNGQADGRSGFVWYSGLGAVPSEKMRLDGYGQIGLGIGFPGHKLHMSSGLFYADGDIAGIVIDRSQAADGAGSGYPIKIIGNSGGAYSIVPFFKGASAMAYLGYGNSGSILSGASANSFSIRSENDLHLGAGGNNLTATLTGGKVGIGTTSPASKLDVSGDAQFGSGVAKATFSATGMLSFPAGGGVATQATFLSSVTVTGIMRANQVAIGTTTPTATINITSTTAQFKFASISLADDGTYAMETNFGSKGIVKIVSMTTNTGYCVFSISGAGNSVVELEDPFTACSDADTDGFIDMIADGDGTYTLKNRQGAAREFAVEYIGQ